MSRLRKNDSGFTMVEALLVLILLVLLVFVGWYVYHTDHKTSTNASSKTSTTSKISEITWTDPSKLFTLEYPSTWSVQQSSSSFQEAAATYYTSADTPSVTFFVPPNSPANAGDDLAQYSGKSTSPNAVTVSAYTTSNTQGVLLANSYGNEQTSPQDLSINGYSAVYDQDILTPSGAQAQYQTDLNTPGVTGVTAPATYTVDRYTVTHNGVTVFFIFTEQEGTGKGQSAFNVTSTVPEFTALVKSIKFLN